MDQRPRCARKRKWSDVAAREINDLAGLVAAHERRTGGIR
jgi:hypothetical protein